MGSWEPRPRPPAGDDAPAGRPRRTCACSPIGSTGRSASCAAPTAALHRRCGPRLAHAGRRHDRARDRDRPAARRRRASAEGTRVRRRRPSVHQRRLVDRRLPRRPRRAGRALPRPAGRRRAPPSGRRCSAAPQRTLQSLRPYATGPAQFGRARRAARHDTLLQGENSIDYPQADQPPEELNLLQRGRHYGWPYCVGARVPARGYEGRFDCATTEAPLQRWPAHAAPLQMIALPKRHERRFRRPVAGRLARLSAGRPSRARLHARCAGRPSGRARHVGRGWDAPPACGRSARRPARLSIGRPPARSSKTATAPC